MQLIINGKDITSNSNVRIESVRHDTYAEGWSDTIEICLTDVDGKWSLWNLTSDDTLEFKDQVSRTGKMFVSKMVARNGQFIIYARSVPKSVNTTRYKLWENVRLSEIGSEIASNHGLSFSNHGVTDQFYEELLQKHDKDLSFLKDLCMKEGAALLVYDGKLVIYDEKSLESQRPQGIIKPDPESGQYELMLNPASEYGTVELKWLERDYFDGYKYKDPKQRKIHFYSDPAERMLRDGEYISEHNYGQDEWFFGEFEPEKIEYTGLFSAPSNNASTLYIDTIRFLSDAEGARWAKGILRNENKHAVSGRIEVELSGNYAAGSVVNIEIEKSPLLNGKVFLTRVTHDYGRNQSTIYFRQCLDY